MAVKIGNTTRDAGWQDLFWHFRQNMFGFLFSANNADLARISGSSRRCLDIVEQCFQEFRQVKTRKAAIVVVQLKPQFLRMKKILFHSFRKMTQDGQPKNEKQVMIYLREMTSFLDQKGRLDLLNELEAHTKELWSAQLTFILGYYKNTLPELGFFSPLHRMLLEWVASKGDLLGMTLMQTNERQNMEPFFRESPSDLSFVEIVLENHHKIQNCEFLLQLIGFDNNNRGIPLSTHSKARVLILGLRAIEMDPDARNILLEHRLVKQTTSGPIYESLPAAIIRIFNKQPGICASLINWFKYHEKKDIRELLLHESVRRAQKNYRS